MNPIPLPVACFSNRRFSGRILLMVAAISFPLCSSPAAEPGVGTGPAWSPPIEVATGNGHRGPWRGNDSEYDYVDDAAVAVNDHGFVAVAWADLPRLDLFLRLYSPDGTAVFEEAVNVSRSPEVFSWIPRLVMSDGATPGEITIHAIWQDIVFRGGGHGGEIFTATSRNGGRTFEQPINLSDVIEGSGKGRTDSKSWHNGSYDIFAGPDGAVHAAWTEYEGRLWYSRSPDAGRHFVEKLHVAGGPGGEGNALPARGPSLAADGDGTVFLAYTVGDISDADIHLLASRDGGGTFGDPITTPASAAYADAPSIALDSSGNLHLVYSASADGPRGRPALRHARMDAGDDVIGAPSTLFAGSGDAAGFPVLRIDSHDRLLLAWERYPGFPGRPHGLGFSHSENGGRSFAPPLVVPGLGGPADQGFNGSQQGLLAAKFSASPAGRLAMANSLFISGESSRILFVTAPPPENAGTR